MTHSDGYRMSLSMPNKMDAERIKRDGFHNDRILAVNLDDARLGWADRELLIAIGEKLYGKPKG